MRRERCLSWQSLWLNYNNYAEIANSTLFGGWAAMKELGLSTGYGLDSPALDR